MEWGGPLVQYYLSYKKGKSGRTDTHRGRREYENEGRDCGDASISQGMTKNASKPPEARREAWDSGFLRAVRRNQTC